MAESEEKATYRSAYTMGMQHFDRFAARWETTDKAFFDASKGDPEGVINLIIGIEFFYLHFVDILVDPHKKKDLNEGMQKIEFLKEDWNKKLKIDPNAFPVELVRVCKDMYRQLWNVAHLLNLGLSLQKTRSAKAEIERSFVYG